ncbi:head-tail adaptor protein [Pleomorphomonas koreensis]|uniref:head-tail adaptor protein n=1 Tax=Pleomorphomonas koreensis TaxID=257440 RepID=UPI000414BC7D|nr:head-tail adaptor protein [Pleomorphomonas koreensis]
MTAAGRLDTRVRFERYGNAGDDGYGNTIQAWAPLIERWAGYRPEFGREAVAAGRLQSTRAGTVTVRRDSGTAGVTPADRIVFMAGPNKDAVAAIRAIIPLVDVIEMTIEIGVAT